MRAAQRARMALPGWSAAVSSSRETIFRLGQFDRLERTWLTSTAGGFSFRASRAPSCPRQTSSDDLRLPRLVVYRTVLWAFWRGCSGRSRDRSLLERAMPIRPPWRTAFLFIDGLPLAVIELKDPDDENATT